MKQTMTIKCVKCGLTVSFREAPKHFKKSSLSHTGFKSWCQSCLDSHAHEIRCNSCGFSCSAIEAHLYFYLQKNRKNGFNSECKSCKNGRSRSVYTPVLPKVKHAEFEMGDCRVVWSRYGRCEQFLTCENYDACLDMAADLNWPGWRCWNDGV